MSNTPEGMECALGAVAKALGQGHRIDIPDGWRLVAVLPEDDGPRVVLEGGIKRCSDCPLCYDDEGPFASCLRPDGPPVFSWDQANNGFPPACPWLRKDKP